MVQGRYRCSARAFSLAACDEGPGVPHPWSQSLHAGATSPSLGVGGRQLNDSYIVLKHLAPLLGLTLDEEWEKDFVLKLDTALKLKPTDKDWARMVHTHMGMPKCLANIFARKMLGPLERKQAENNMKNSGLGHADVDVLELARKFKTAIGTNAYVGGQSPGTPELSFYGVLANFLQAKCEIADEIIACAGLQEWLERMQALVPLKTLFASTKYAGA
ncbi:unnamed protein product [Polarella glacialis]|uniref:Uncharacterized protein n=1 Tax=Polarella glacialis TaxID=89957 RepID=A0A813I3H4_POLGL|nr:unnamed protein product [Polarella glacialis]